MVHVFIGFISSLVLYFGYSFFQPNAKMKHYFSLYFIVLTTFGVAVIHSYNSFWLWMGLNLALYLCLEDFTKKSFTPSIPLWLSLCFYFFDRNPYFLLWATVYFLFFLFLDWIWNKFIANRYVSENFDILFIFPLFYLLFFHKNLWIAYFVFLIFLMIARITKESIIGEADVWFSLPFLYLFHPSTYFSVFIMSCLISLPFAFHYLQTQNKDNFPFSPFLLGGFLVVYADNPYISLSLLVVSFFSVFILWILKLVIRKKEK